jgi:hypothetical protein
LLVELQTKS